jgi:DnaJ-class molecular chaperone
MSLTMLIAAIAALMLVLLIVISRDINMLRNEVESVGKALTCSTCHGSGRDRDSDDPEERCPRCFGSGTTLGETNRWLGLTLGTLDSIHSKIDHLWACPDCHGSGFITNLENLFDFITNPENMVPPQECETCGGTGMRPAGMKWPIPGRSGEQNAKENR